MLCKPSNKYHCTVVSRTLRPCFRTLEFDGHYSRLITFSLPVRYRACLLLHVFLSCCTSSNNTRRTPRSSGKMSPYRVKHCTRTVLDSSPSCFVTRFRCTLIRWSYILARRVFTRASVLRYAFFQVSYWLQRHLFCRHQVYVPELNSLASTAATTHTTGRSTFIDSHISVCLFNCRGATEVARRFDSIFTGSKHAAMQNGTGKEQPKNVAECSEVFHECFR